MRRVGFPLCLICLQQHHAPPVGEVEESTHAHYWSPPDDGEKFVNFCRHYLKIPEGIGLGFRRIIISNDDDPIGGGGGGSGREGGSQFCGKCASTMKLLLEAYHQLREVESRLLWRMKELTELISGGGGGGGGGSEEVDIKAPSLTDVMRIEEIGVLQNFRDEVKNKCSTMILKITPVLSLSQQDAIDNMKPITHPPGTGGQPNFTTTKTADAQVKPDHETGGVRESGGDPYSKMTETRCDDTDRDEDMMTMMMMSPCSSSKSNDDEIEIEGPLQTVKMEEVMTTTELAKEPSPTRESISRKVNLKKKTKTRLDQSTINRIGMGMMMTDRKMQRSRRRQKPEKKLALRGNQYDIKEDEDEEGDDDGDSGDPDWEMRTEISDYDDDEERDEDERMSLCSNNEAESDNDDDPLAVNVEEGGRERARITRTTRRKERSRRQNPTGIRPPRPREKSEKQCNHCYQIFPNQHKLKLHKIDSGHYDKSGKLKGATNVHVQTCTPCSTKFEDPLSLFDHMALHHDKKDLLVCTICQESLSNSMHLRKHLYDHHESPEDKSIYCRYCFESFTTSQMRDLHTKFLHLNQPQAYYCDSAECPLEFDSVSELNSHLVAAHQPEIFTCDKCHWGFLTPHTRTLHQFNHLKMEEEEGYYQCQHCYVRSISHQRLMKHWNSQHSGSSRIELFQCDVKCGFWTFSQKEAAWHNKSHEGLQFRCQHCEQVFFGRKALNEHRKKEHVPSKPRKFYKGTAAGGKRKTGMKMKRCVYCSAEFETVKELTRHRRAEHPGSNRGYLDKGKGAVICDQCGHKCDGRAMLLKHQLSRHHTSGPELECGVAGCGKRFKTNSDLVKHMGNVHVCDNVVCEHCAKSFKSLKHLRRHVKDVHITTKKLYCPNCPKSFYVESHLHSHLRIHAGYVLKCQWCWRKFRCVEGKMKHVEQKHADRFEEYSRDILPGEREDLEKFTKECIADALASSGQTACAVSTY